MLSSCLRLLPATSKIIPPIERACDSVARYGKLFARSIRVLCSQDLWSRQIHRIQNYFCSRKPAIEKNADLPGVKLSSVSFNDDLNTRLIVPRTNQLTEYDKHTDLGPRYFPTSSQVMTRSQRCKNYFIPDEWVIDLFREVQDEISIKRGERTAVKIQGRWLLGQGLEKVSFATCAAMLGLDADKEKSPDKCLLPKFSLNRTKRYLDSVGVEMQIVNLKEALTEEKLTELLVKSVFLDWKSLVVKLNPKDSESRYVIVDVFDRVTGVLDIRDPYHKRSLSIHFDHFMKLNPCTKIYQFTMREKNLKETLEILEGTASSC